MSSNPLLAGSLNFSESSVFVGSFVKFTKSTISGFCDCCSGIGCKSVVGGEKVVLYIVCFAYSLLSLLVVVFSLLSSQTVFISTHELPLLSISPPHPAGGKGRGERAAVWCFIASCWVKLWHFCVLFFLRPAGLA